MKRFSVTHAPCVSMASIVGNDGVSRMHAYDDLGDSALIEKYKHAWIDLVARCRLGKAPDMNDLNEFHWISMAIQQRQLRQTAEYQKMITAADEEAWKRVEMTARRTL